MRYDKLRKLERNQALREYIKTHSGLSLEEVGQMFNISRQRVWAILKKSKNELKNNPRSKSERIKAIVDMMEDYRWNPDEIDPVKCANIIDDMYDEWTPARHHLNNMPGTRQDALEPKSGRG